MDKVESGRQLGDERDDVVGGPIWALDEHVKKNDDTDTDADADDDTDAGPIQYGRNRSGLMELRLYADDPSITRPDDFRPDRYRERPMSSSPVEVAGLIGGCAPVGDARLLESYRQRDPLDEVVPCFV
jgi:hypothetical protein